MHNAMWKLAWFVLGRAGRTLVTTYETERRGVSSGSRASPCRTRDAVEYILAR
jgi:hypothetical protein